MEELKASISQYKSQLAMVEEALKTTSDDNERDSLLTLQNDLDQLVHLTQESLDTIIGKTTEVATESQKETKDDLEDEYALFMEEMAKSGVYDDSENPSKTEKEETPNSDDSDIEDELATLLGMKCSVYHTHKWGGQPTLHNAMVSAIIPKQDDDQFKDLKVRVLYTHPTHAEMLPCPFYLDGECKFSDEQCRYSHGSITQLSSLKEAIEPNFESIEPGSRILLKLKPPDNEDISLTKKSTEKYHLWHRAVVKCIDAENKTCVAKLEQGIKTGEKRKLGSDQYNVRIEDIFPLNNDNKEDSDSDNSLSDDEYAANKTPHTKADAGDNRDLLIQKSLENNAPAMGAWERHTRGIGSKLMLAMGYVPGTGLGAASDGRVQPVEARLVPLGKSLDHLMAISEKNSGQDPLKVEQKLKRLQKKEEERNKRAYEREKERERRNVFNFLNNTLAGQPQTSDVITQAPNVKESTSKDLNIEQFKIAEDTKKLERDVTKLKSSLIKYPTDSNGYRSINTQILEKNKELSALLRRQQQITKEQTHRKDKQKMTVF